MNSQRLAKLLLVCLALCQLGRSAMHADEFTVEQLDFFERNVRPVLVAHCYECHSEAEAEGGLRLDHRAAALHGGDRGSAVVPGNANRSLLIRAIGYEDENLAMPPDGKLRADQIANLTKWIEQQAAWPDAAVSATDDEAKPASADHWAFRSVEKLELPNVDDPWVRNPIDRFVFAKLEANNLSPSPPANARTLVRRVFLDLTGLPPTYDQIQELERQPISDVVEQLLARRTYGERWGRHWLDVARYADTKGYVDGGQRRYAFAYTYRDYVIRAFNEDLPFDQMVIDQLAADLRDYGEADRWRLAGMGFLTVGRRFNHNFYDTVDDQIDVISRGLQGLTVSCARCHDHKFDPIPTADYYSLYGIFANSDEPSHACLPVLAAERSSEHRCKLHSRTWQYEQRLNEIHRQIEHELRAFAGDYLVYVVRESARHRDGTQNSLKTPRTILRAASAYGYGAIRRWRNYVASCSEDDPVFGVWQRMDALPKTEFQLRIAVEIARPHVNRVLKSHLSESAPKSMVALATSYGELLEAIDAEWRRQRKTDSELTQLRDAEREKLRQVLYGDKSPARLTPFESIDCYTLDEHVEIRNLAGKVEEYSVDAKDIAPRAMILRQSDAAYQPVVFRRGQPDRPGEPVPLRVPAFFLMDKSVSQRSFETADRLSLAHAITDPGNPLTARVIVNRIWGWHFGQPLVATVSDFGIRSTPPTHPELLDYLARWFVDHGWSVKQLHRLIMNSSTYQQASRTRARALNVDPENQLLWRFRPRRLSWEAIRDSLLAVSGRLSEHAGGPSIRQSPSDPNSVCRTIYLDVDRQEIPKFAQYFDFPTPDFTSSLRPITTVPQQQLFFLNSPFVQKQAEGLGTWAAGLDVPDTGRFRELYRRIACDDPQMSDQEVHAIIKALQTSDTQNGSLWSIIAHAMLQSNAFIMIE